MTEFSFFGWAVPLRVYIATLRHQYVPFTFVGYKNNSGPALVGYMNSEIRCLPDWFHLMLVYIVKDLTAVLWLVNYSLWLFSQKSPLTSLSSVVLYFAGGWGAWAGNRCGWAAGSAQWCWESHSSEGLIRSLIYLTWFCSLQISPCKNINVHPSVLNCALASLWHFICRWFDSNPSILELFLKTKVSAGDLFQHLASAFCFHWYTVEKTAD